MVRAILLTFVLSGCYLSVRGGPTVHRSSQLSFDKTGWNLSAYIGIQHDFLGQKLRLALNGGAGATAQRSAMGDFSINQGGGGVEADLTLKNWVWFRAPAQGCKPGGALGARWRAGLGVHGNAGFEEGGEITAPDGTATKIKTTGGWVIDADTEWGVFLGKFNVYGGAGIAWSHNDTEMFGGVDAFSPYAQVSIGFNVFFPRGLAVLMSHYPAVQAEDQARYWRAVDCRTSSDPSACERARDGQVTRWEQEAEQRRAEGAAFRARCL